MFFGRREDEDDDDAADDAPTNTEANDDNDGFVVDAFPAIVAALPANTF